MDERIGEIVTRSWHTYYMYALIDICVVAHFLRCMHGDVCMLYMHVDAVGGG